MALIKKYNRGGSFADYVKNKAAKGELPLTNKSWAIVEESLPYFDVNTPTSGNADKKKKKVNWAGQFVVDPETVGDFLTDLYTEYQQNAPKQISITPEGGWGPADRTVGDLMSYIARTKYHGNEDYTVQEIGKMTNNNDIKRYLINEMNNLFTDYETHASSDTTGDNWKDLNKIRELKNIFSNIDTSKDISDDDWAKIGSYLQNSGFDWNLNDYLITDDEFKRREEQAAANEVKEKRDTALSSFESLGISNPELRESLYNAGYTKVADNFSPELSQYFKNKGYSVVSDESGKNYRVFKGNDLVSGVSGLMTEDQFSPDYGKYFTINDGVFSVTDTAPEGFQLPTWEDEGNRWKGLLSDDPNFKDYIIKGYSRDNFQNKYDRDKLGRRDYTGRLEFSTIDGNSFIVNRGEDGKYYKEDGTLFEVPKLIGFTGTQGAIIRNIDEEYLNNPKSALYGIKSKKSYSTIQDLERDLDTIANDIKRSRVTGKLQVNEKQLRKIAESISYYLKNDTNNFNKADELAKKLQILYNEKVNPEDPTSAYLLNFKQGGVLKAQSGTSFAAIADKGGRTKGSKQPSENTTSMSSSGKSITVQDVSNAWKNASGLKRASTIASAASMVPVLGVAGGATSTVLDAIDGAQDGWDRKDTMNLLGNLGFTVLAGVGLGGAKVGKLLGTAGKAVKAAKGVDPAADVAKLVSKTDKAKKVIEQAQKAGKLTGDAADFADSTRKVLDKATEAQKILQGADNAKDLAKAKKSAESILKSISSKDLEIVENLSKVKTTWAGQHAEGIVEGAKATGRFLRDKAPVVGKAAKIGLVGQTAISGASGAADLVGNIAQSEGNIFQKIGRGFADTDLNSIRKVAQLGAISRIGYLNRRNANAFLRNTEEVVGKDAVNAIKVGDKTYNLSKSFKGKNANWFSLFRRVENSKLSKGQLNSLEKELKASLKDNDVQVIMDAIKKEGVGAIKNVSTAAEDVRRVLKESPGIGYRNVRDYNRAKEMIERGSVQQGSFKSMYNKSSGKSYTPKDIGAEKDVIAKAKTKTAASDLGKRGSAARAAANKELDLQKLFKENKTVREAVIKFYGKDVKVQDLGKKVRPSQFNKKGEKGGLYQVLRDLNMPKNKQGGVLKMALGNNFPSIYTKNLTLPKFDLSNLRFTNPYSTSQTGFTYFNPDIQKANQAFSAKYPNVSKATQSFGYNSATSSLSSSSSSNVPDETIDEFKVELFKKKPYINYSLLTEVGKLAKSKQTNARSTAEQIKAAAQVPYLSTIQAPQLRTSTPFAALYEKEAGNLQSSGKRIADTTADWDKAAGARLSASKQASDIRLQGQHQDIARNDAITSQQNELNNRVLEYNTNIMNQNAARGADARSKIHQLIANRIFIDGMGEQNFLSFLGREATQAPIKKALWDLQQESSNPNITRAYDYLEYLNDEGQKAAKRAWQASEDARKGQPYYTPVKWEDSDQYKEWEKRRSAHQNKINDLLANYQRAQRVASTMSYFQRGGKMTLEDRIALENVKYNHKKLLKNDELYFKQLMNNSKLVQKALIKVFK